MKHLLVSARPSDAVVAGRVVERLSTYFGAKAVVARDALATGSEPAAPERDQAFRQCGALVLVIGPRWLDERDEAGRRLLDDAGDGVRSDIETALGRGIPVVPVLARGAAMPTEEQLPPSLQLLVEQDPTQRAGHGRESLLALVGRAGLPVREDPDFGPDVQRLCAVLDSIAHMEAVDPTSEPRKRRRALLWSSLGVGTLLALHGVVLALLAGHWMLPPGSPSDQAGTFWVRAAWWAPLVDLVTYAAVGYWVSRRTESVSAGVWAAVAAQLLGSITGGLALADVIWSNWVTLNDPTRTTGVDATTNGTLTGFSYTRMYGLVILMVIGAVVGLVVAPFVAWLAAYIGRAGRRMAMERARVARRLALAGIGDGARPASTSIPLAAFRLWLPGKLFISYRRDDSRVACGYIYDRLVDIFGRDAVFKDVDAIPIGVDFQRYIDWTLAQCAAQIVVIGPSWVSIAGADGRRRLDNPGDFVRLEVETALTRGIRVVVALVDGASLPAAEDLPESLRPLARCVAVPVHPGPDFERDLRTLGGTVAQMLGFTADPRLYWGPAPQAQAAPQAQPANDPRRDWRPTWLPRIDLTLFFALFAAHGVAVALSAISLLAVSLNKANGHSAHASILAQSFVVTEPIIAVFLWLLSGFVGARHTARIGRGILLSLVAVTVGFLPGGIVAVVGLGETTTRLGQSTQSSSNTVITYIGFMLLTLVFLVFNVIGTAAVATLGAAIGKRVATPIARSYRLMMAPGAMRFVGPSQLPAQFPIRPDAPAKRLKRLPQQQRSSFSMGWRQLLSLLPARRALLVSYRAADAAAGERLVGALTERFGRGLIRASGSVAPAITLGEESPRQAIEMALRRCAALIVVIGPQWLTETDAQGGRRLDDPDDGVHVEIESALALGIPVFPVLLDGARAPSQDDLPPSLRGLALLNGAFVRSSGGDYPRDVAQLARAVESGTGLRAAARSLRRMRAAAIAIACAIFAARDVVLEGATVRAYAHGYTASATASSATTGWLWFAADAVMCLAIGLALSRKTGRIGSGAWAAFLGTLVGNNLLSGGLWILLAITHGAPIALVTSAAGQAQLVSDAAGTVAIVMPLGLAGNTFIGALGGLFGALVFRAQDRRARARALYAALTRAEEVKAAQVRAGTSTDVNADAAKMGATSASGTDAGTALDGNEAGRRERIASERLAARQRARRMTQVRLATAGAAVLAVLLISSLLAIQGYQSQQRGLSAQATEAASAEGRATQAVKNADATATTNAVRAGATATVVTAHAYATATVVAGQANATATAVALRPYTAAAPGPNCDHGGGTWQVSQGNVTCMPNAMDLKLANGSPTIGDVYFYESSRAFAYAYAVDVDVVNLPAGSCGGLGTNGPNGHPGGYGFFACADGSWQVYRYDAGNGNATLLKQGSGGAAKSAYHVRVTVAGNSKRFFIDGNVAADIYDSTFTDTALIALLVTPVVWPGSAEAAFSNFVYTPQG